MTFVDLRGREREPEVLSLLEPDPAWILVGWSRDERLVACAGLERVSDDDVAVRALAAAEPSDARTLLEEITRAATTARLIAEAGEEGASLYDDAGFEREQLDDGRVRWTRDLVEKPGASNAVRATSLAEIEAAIRAAWGRETSDIPTTGRKRTRRAASARSRRS